MPKELLIHLQQSIINDVHSNIIGRRGYIKVQHQVNHSNIVKASCMLLGRNDEIVLRTIGTHRGNAELQCGTPVTGPFKSPILIQRRLYTNLGGITRSMLYSKDIVSIAFSVQTHGSNCLTLAMYMYLHTSMSNGQRCKHWWS